MGKAYLSYATYEYNSLREMEDHIKYMTTTLGYKLNDYDYDELYAEFEINKEEEYPYTVN